MEENFISYTKGTKRTFNEAPLVSGKVRFHPCQKPVPVLEKIIATHTNKGDTVLDCFMSSGSTGQDAINLNRNFIGFELDNTYLTKLRRPCTKMRKVNDVIAVKPPKDIIGYAYVYAFMLYVRVTRINY
ncbi:hypothetical protein C6W19_21705 [Bacillus sp. RJGP41]|nr:hypothetical protein C6W19_21705 [Bacillus sp. RJGP41]